MKKITEKDKIIGRLLKQKRLEKGSSQNSLGKILDITHQQVHKYEAGENRISASKLYELAYILNTDIKYFYQEFPKIEKVANKLNNKIFKVLLKIDDGDKQILLTFMRSLASNKK